MSDNILLKKLFQCKLHVDHSNSHKTCETLTLNINLSVCRLPSKTYCMYSRDLHILSVEVCIGHMQMKLKRDPYMCGKLTTAKCKSSHF
jgi:hypothetical protein